MSEPIISVLAQVSKAQQETLSAAVKEGSRRKVGIHFTSLHDLESSFKRAMPDFLVLDYDEEIVARIDLLTQKYAGINIVVLLPKKQIDQANQILLAGARAFIPLPFKDEEFINTFVRLSELGERSHLKKEDSTSPHIDSNRMVVIYSPRGGAGCSTVAVNLGITLQSNSSKRTLLVDGKNNFGHLDLMLNIKADTDITDLVPHADQLESRLIDSVVQEHVSGLYTLLGPKSVEDGQAVQAEHIFQIARVLMNDFGYTLIDCGNQLDDKSVTWMDVSQKVLLVISPNLADLRDARRFLVFMNSLNISADKFLLILNRVGLKGTISAEEIENALGVKVFATIPHDEPRVVRAMNRGVPFCIDEPRSPIAKAFTSFAQKLDGLLKSEVFSEDISKRGRRDLLTTTSRLG